MPWPTAAHGPARRFRTAGRHAHVAQTAAPHPKPSPSPRLAVVTTSPRPQQGLNKQRGQCSVLSPVVVPSAVVRRREVCGDALDGGGEARGEDRRQRGCQRRERASRTRNAQQAGGGRFGAPRRTANIVRRASDSFRPDRTVDRARVRHHGPTHRGRIPSAPNGAHRRTHGDESLCPSPSC